MTAIVPGARRAAVLAGMPRAQLLLDGVRESPSAPLVVGVLAPGGCGKSALLNRLRDAYDDAGITVVGAGTLLAGADISPAADIAVLVDDAQALPARALERVETLVRAGTRTVLAFRPWPRHPALIAAAAAVRWSRPLVVLGHLDRSQLQDRADALSGCPVSTPAMDFLEHTSGGLPLLVDLLLDHLSEDALMGLRPAEVTPAMVDEARELLVDLDAPCFDLLHAVAVGAELSSELLTSVLGLEASRLRAEIDRARATGFLMRTGSVAPLIASALVQSAPADRTRAVRSSLLSLGSGRDGDVVGLARKLVADGSREPRLAAMLAASAQREVHVNPERSLQLFEEAQRAGAAGRRTSVGHAVAAALTGRFDIALGLADSVLVDGDRADAARAIEVSATISAHRGQLGRAAELYSWLGADQLGGTVPLAVLTFLGVGARSDAAALVEAGVGGANPTLVGGALRSMASALWESVVGQPVSAMATMARAAALLESSASRAVLLPDSPAALTALLAIHNGRLDIAESTLNRALELGVGGPIMRTREQLLAGWSAMLAGRFEDTRSVLEQVASQQQQHRLEQRDELMYLALQLGLARRASDVPALIQTWSHARAVILRSGVDLYASLAVAEIIVTAARLHESDVIAPLIDGVWEVIARLGDPPVWAAPLHWAGVQAAILNNRPPDLVAHMAALRSAAGTSSVAAVLHDATKVWIEVLQGTCQPGAVQQAAHQLRALGLAWDGSRLLGQAASRSTDRRVATDLMQAARALADVSEPAPAVHVDPDRPGDTRVAGVPFGLSDREREVARLLLINHTYREIGERLFISPKTVEHHVARIKQRVGAESRADLLLRLRSAFEDSAN